MNFLGHLTELLSQLDAYVGVMNAQLLFALGDALTKHLFFEK
jgi:hypothetical protein